MKYEETEVGYFLHRIELALYNGGSSHPLAIHQPAYWDGTYFLCDSYVLRYSWWNPKQPPGMYETNKTL